MRDEVSEHVTEAITGAPDAFNFLTGSIVFLQLLVAVQGMCSVTSLIPKLS
jgi:hypothetical protein